MVRRKYKSFLLQKNNRIYCAKVYAIRNSLSNGYIKAFIDALNVSADKYTIARISRNHSDIFINGNVSFRH